ncbi:hypothetical protein BKA58DRAFT_437454 [Alternaria rosae]|uniref:uncharacterized protein n=1 Tax=Alternaria rosae TaxID=1187941 RepID=UPI001E8DC97F|nr:uncharacterized protein BKA58DRAFT_437454 [Alternaria rosae]KAH6875476.1 hypothetical protein BKA58DRAFT_437454 [Alternaria rosae]
MQFLYALLPLIPIAAANGRIRFTSFDHPGCAGFEETYDLNPAPVKGNFPGPRGSINMIVTSAGCHLTLYTGPNQSSPNGGPIRFDTGAAVCWSNGGGFEDYLSFGYYCD